MHRKFSRAASKVMACVLCAVTAFSNITPLYADSGGFITEEIGGNIAITGIDDDSIIQGGTLTIPGTIDGKKVFRLGGTSGAYGFLGRSSVTKLTIGENITSVTSNAFWGAENLEEVDTSLTDGLFQVIDGALLVPDGHTLIKYLSPTEQDDYMVPDTITTAYSMDHAEWNTLNLNDVSNIYRLTFAGSKIGTLSIGSDVTAQGSHDILYGALVDSFSADEESTYETDGNALWYGNRLIKLAAGVMAEDYDRSFFEQFGSISPYAFNSIAQYRELESVLPESLVRNVVFSFFNQDDAVFMVNGNISFCYNYQKMVPTEVGGVVDYSTSIDSDKYNAIKALMYVGVPFDGTGLFEECFGVPYEDAVEDSSTLLYGDAALNAVSAMVYQIVDGKYPSEIRGTGYGVFDESAVKDYLNRLMEAANDYEDYNFIPSFETQENIISFSKQGDGSYLSTPVTVNTLTGTGMVNNGYIYTINIKTPGITVEGSESTSFKTGESVVFRSTKKPESLSFTYNEPSLKYYVTGNEYQDILVSATEESVLELDVIVTVDDLVISKVDAATGNELPGASLTLKKDGEVIAQWVSTDTPHIIKSPADGTYELIEITAPDGYEVAESITFEIVDGEVIGGPIVMRDQPKKDGTPFEFRKTDAATGEELPGAKIVITTKDGQEIDRWISTSKPHVIYGLEDGLYVMTELTAPDGYEVAESITFEIADGKIVGGPVVMEDQPEKDRTPFEFSKTDAATGAELPGAKLIVTTKDGEEIDRWTSTSKPHIIYNLKDGLYVMTELTAPKGYQVAESIEFEVLNGEIVGGPIIMEDEPDEVATPSTPSEPDEPDEPDKPATPSVPDNSNDDDDGGGGSGTNGGHSGGGGGGSSRTPGGDSSNGPGVTNTETPAQTPDDTSSKGDINTNYDKGGQEDTKLPVTADIRAAGVMLAASAATLLFLLLQKRKKTTGNL